MAQNRSVVSESMDQNDRLSGGHCVGFLISPNEPHLFPLSLSFSLVNPSSAQRHLLRMTYVSIRSKSSGQKKKKVSLCV